MYIAVTKLGLFNQWSQIIIRFCWKVIYVATYHIRRKVELFCYLVTFKPYSLKYHYLFPSFIYCLPYRTLINSWWLRYSYCAHIQAQKLNRYYIRIKTNWCEYEMTFSSHTFPYSSYLWIISKYFDE